MTLDKLNKLLNIKTRDAGFDKKCIPTKSAHGMGQEGDA